MIAKVSPEVVPMLAAEDAVNQYLIEHHEVCLEEVLSDAVDGRAHQSLAEVVQVTAGCLYRSRDEDGAVTELYEGVLAERPVRERAPAEIAVIKARQQRTNVVIGAT
jgi:hypothetical protein